MTIPAGTETSLDPIAHLDFAPRLVCEEAENCPNAADWHVTFTCCDAHNYLSCEECRRWVWDYVRWNPDATCAACKTVASRSTIRYEPLGK